MHFLKKLKIFRYFLVGGVAAVVNIGIFSVFAKLAGFNYIAVGAIGFIIATFVNYVLSLKYVFKSGARFERKIELIWVYIVSLVGMGIDLGVLYLCIDILCVEMMTSKLIATGVVFFWNYYARKHFVFKELQKPLESSQKTHS